MRRYLTLILLTFLVIFSACYAPANEVEIVEETPKFLIVPLGDVPESDMLSAKKALDAAFDLDFTIADAEPLPDYAYIEDRDQYNASAILKHYSNVNAKTVLVMTANITLKDKRFVFGAAYRPGTVVVISTYAMKGKRSRFLKTLIHEVGHSYDLDHCENKKCVVSATNGNYDIDCQDNYFCEECTTKLGLDDVEVNRRTVLLNEIFAEAP